MSDPSYAKVPLQDPALAPSAPPVDAAIQQGSAPPPPHVYDPPPPYEAANYGPPPQGYQPVPGVAQGPPAPYGQPQAPAPYVPQPSPVPVVVPQPQQATVVVTQTLAPGVCSVCRKGKMKDTRTACTYLCCLFWCMFGILPGIIAFCCCCRETKCSHCGYTPC